MTSTLANRRPPGERRRGIVYGYRTLRPEDAYASIELGYVGQTRQRLRSRDGQHREVQPWEDIIVGAPYVIAQGMWTDAELDAAEEAAIRELCPRYNWEFNGDNQCQIPKWEALSQRHERDAAAGRVSWQPPVAVVVAGRRVVDVPGWRWWSLAGSLLWPALGWSAFGAGAALWESAATASAGTAGLLGWAAWHGRRVPAQRRRRR